MSGLRRPGRPRGVADRRRHVQLRPERLERRLRRRDRFCRAARTELANPIEHSPADIERIGSVNPGPAAVKRTDSVAVSSAQTEPVAHAHAHADTDTHTHADTHADTHAATHADTDHARLTRHRLTRAPVTESATSRHRLPRPRTRLRALRIYPRSDQKTAIQFLDYLIARLPFQIERIQRRQRRRVPIRLPLARHRPGHRP